MNKPKKHILSFSGGKDSTYLLLELIRRKYPLDEVVFFDTGWEFPAMYEHIEKCKRLCEENSIMFTTLYPPKNFNYLMFEHTTSKGNKGYSWCGGNTRWGTFYKTQTLDKWSQQNKGNIVYIGIAVDETERLEKDRKDFKRFPLVEWGITESECLQGCYDAGYDWGGMYKYLDRLSCMYCRNKNNKELRNIRKHYPAVWEELKSCQRKTDLPYRTKGVSIFDIERRFEVEDEFIAQGKKLRTKEFFNELKARGINY